MQIKKAKKKVMPQLAAVLSMLLFAAVAVLGMGISGITAKALDISSSMSDRYKLVRNDWLAGSHNKMIPNVMSLPSGATVSVNIEKGEPIGTFMGLKQQYGDSNYYLFGVAFIIVNPIGEKSYYMSETPIEIIDEIKVNARDYLEFSEYGDYSLDFYLVGASDSQNFKILAGQLTYSVLEPVELPEDPTKEGYTFAGWYYGTDEEHGENCTAYDGEPIYQNTALHAHWKINRYIVTYNSNGGVAVDSVTVDWNTAAPTPEATRTGYDFKGWYTADGVQYNGEAVTADITLTAKWDIQIYTVTFYANGEEYKSIKVPYGTTLADVMRDADVQSYGAFDMADLRVSKQSVITEDTQVLMHELTAWEKYGDFVGRSPWYTWLTVGVGGVLLVFSIVGIVSLIKKR